MSECPVCAENAATDRGDDQWAVAELAAGYVRLNPTRYYPGVTFFAHAPGSASCTSFHPTNAPCISGHGCSRRSLFRAFQPRKLNDEALGNSLPRGWWLTPPAAQRLPLRTGDNPES